VHHTKKNKKIILSYNTIISLENLFVAWEEFLNGKRDRKDVQEFSLCLADNIYKLHTELKIKTYRHGRYQAFTVNDPKPRDIHKASVRDRLLHHAVHRKLSGEFERFFIADSYSCRKDKGVHKALNRFRQFGYAVSKNNTKTCWILKCDIKKCFASIDHDILMRVLFHRLADADIIYLLEEIIRSFHSGISEKGLPLGNLTSQLLVNVYLNELDQFVKQTLLCKCYIRYSDDFVLFHRDRKILEKYKEKIEIFLKIHLKLSLHPHKVSIGTFASGMDFLGWVHFPDHRVLRTATKNRMFRTLKEKQDKKETVASYLGMLSNGNAYRLKSEVESMANNIGDKVSKNKSSFF